MNITKELLQSLCGDEHNDHASKPFSIHIDGYWWNGCTNGRGMLLVRPDIGEFMLGAFKRENTPPVDRILQPQKAKPTHVARFSLLAKWLDNCTKWHECRACLGSGKHDCDCYFCEIPADSTCPGCDGDKGDWSQQQVDFAQWSFDRVLAARYLMPFAATEGEIEVFFGGELDPIEFRHAEWRVVIMPMKRGDGNKDTTGTVPEGLIREVGA